MRFPRPRLSVRTMLGLVAVSALLIWGWRTYYDPVRLWKSAIRDKEDAGRRIAVIRDTLNGQVPGITPDQAIDEFIWLLGDKGQNSSVRDTAAIALGAFKKQARRAIPTLVAALRGDESPIVREQAAFRIYQILGDHPDDGPIEREAVAGLVAALTDPDPLVRRMSACGLGWVGKGEVAIPTLIEALKKPELTYMARKEIITALLRSGPKAVAALPAVLELAKDESIDKGHFGGVTGRRGYADALIYTGGFLHRFGQTDRTVEILRRLSQNQDSEIADIAAEAAKILAAIETARAAAESEASP